jgi:predicted DNA-binding protein
MKGVFTMIQRNVGIKKEQWERLKSISLETGAPISALIRKAIDGFLKTKAGK